MITELNLGFWVKTVQRLRNRVFHHEPVLKSSNRLYAGYGSITVAELVECVEWICADTAAWLRTQFRFTAAVQLLSAIQKMGISL